jgi:xanthine/CO dehydrogenase XdhC/CoxF family maturation factor
MTIESNKELLELLQSAHNRGESATIFHIFSEGNEVGKLALSGSASWQVGDINSVIKDKLKVCLDKLSNGLSRKQVSELLVDDFGASYRAVVEVLEPPASLYVFGAGHVGQAVALIGALVGYKVVVVDDRKEFLTPERFPNPNIDLREEQFDQIYNKVKIPGNSAVIIVTRGHQYDEICLRQIINLNTRYVGMIGSRRRVIAIFRRLIEEGISEHLLDKVHAPIGLKIGAVSPQEIAIAIMAEVIDIMNNSKSDCERR